MRKLFAAGVALVLAAVALGALPPFGRAAAASHTVDVIEYDYAPKEITVNAGDTIVWDWIGFENHTVTSDESLNSVPLFDSGILRRLDPNQPGPTYSRQFDTPGTYKYYCFVHSSPGASVGMNGTVVVLGAPTNTPQPTTNTPAADDETTGTPTRTRTPTPEATSTPQPVSTATAAGQQPAASATRPAVEAISGPVNPSGGAAPSAQLPRAGEGAAGGTPLTRWLSLALAGAGLAAVATSVASRIARRR